MPDKPFKERRMNEYFGSLPAHIQETILQSAAKPDTLDALEKLASGLMDSR